MDQTPVTMTSLEDVASETLLIEQTQRRTEPPNAHFDRLFSTQERNPFLGWNPGPQTLRNVRIPNAMLAGDFRGIFTAAGFVQGTQYLTPVDVMAAMTLAPDRIVHDDDPAPVIVGCNNIYHNYFHWVTQALPAIDLSMRHAAQARNARLALPPLRPWQEESLSLLGYGTTRRVTVADPERLYAFRLLEQSNVLNGSSAFALSDTTEATFRRLREAVDMPRQTDRRIYVARTDAPSRRMRNEASLIDALAKRGFEIVEAGNRSFTEQIATFQSAALIVGPHGAGLSNLVFCRPGTVVYELVPAGYTNVCFGNLACLLGIPYWADKFASEEDPAVPPSFRSWASDTAAVVARVEEIEQILRRQQEAARQQPISAMDFLRGKEGVLAADRRPAEAPAPVSWLGRLLRRFGLRRG